MGRKSLKPIRQKGIIQAFYKVARKEGLENASIAKVASVLDVNPSLVMHYFKTKQDLTHGLIEYILERYRLIYNPQNGTANPKERLEKTIQNLFSRKWNKLFDDGVFYSSFSLIFRDPKTKIHYKKLHDHLREMLTGALMEAKTSGVIAVEDVEKTADLVFIFVEGAYYYLSMVSDKSEYQNRIELYEKTVLSMLNFV
ncbi:MAG: TetR/AcrR family transcriptional regulator [Bacteroidetes bacterium]|nr:TetR/AcrR family transcriptional regulator [Bacteroidota bacterium]MBI3481711.1 TetR/AcrR family transcriptional regulator [Bacteroidota bacterium]